MRRTMDIVATTLFQRDASSGRMLFLGCLAVVAITRLDPESAVRPPAVVAFFEERRGRLYGFRWHDRLDFQSSAPGAAPAASDQAIGTGDGETDTFQFVKTYGSAYAPYVRLIAKPVAGSVQVPGATVEQSLKQELAKQGAPNAAVNCPDNIIVKLDTTVTCDVTGAGGKAGGSVTFTFSSAAGTIDTSSVKTS